MNPLRPVAAGAALLTAATALALVPATEASAHPLGNFTVNRYDGLVAAPGELRVRHVEDLAEIPATQAAPDLAELGHGAWARRRCASAARDSAVRADGRPAPLTVRAARVQVRPGQAGLDTLRVECRLTAPLPQGRTVAVGFRAAGGDSGPGWREITARGDRTTLAASDVPEASPSAGLTRYPYTIEKGVASGISGQPLPYMAIGAFYVRSLSEYQASIGPNRDAIRADFPNYTNIAPVILVSEVVR